jgi:type I restriction enzyme S subunit
MAAALHPLFETRIPAEWRLLKVDDIKSTEKYSCVAGPFGSNISAKFFVETGVPVIRGGNLRDDLTRFVPEGFAFVSAEQATKYKAQHVRAGDLVFTCWGTLGQVGLIPEDGPFPEYIISNKQLKLRVNRELADPIYLFFYFAGPKMVQHVLGKAIGAAVPGINLGILKELPVVLPPLPLQQRIAGILSTYDDLIKNNQRRIQVLQEMAGALYREWFVHFRFPGHEKVKRVDSRFGPIPQGWEVGRLDDVLVLQRGFDLPKAQRVDGTVPIYAATGVTGFHNEAKVKAPGVVTGRSGTIGDVVYVQEDFWPLNTALWAKAFPRSEPLYAYYVLSTLELNQFNSGAAVPTLNRNDIHGLSALVPPRSLQKQFQGIAGAMFAQALTLKKIMENLRQTRDLLLPQLLSGQVNLETD